MTSLSKDESENYAEAGAVAEEVLSSVRTVVAFGGQEKEVGKYAALLKSAQKNAFIRGGLTATTMGLFFGSASKSSIRRFVITEKAPTRAFSSLKTATTAFTFKTLLRHYAKRALTPRSLNVKLGPRRNYHKGRAAIRHYANQTARPL